MQDPFQTTLVLSEIFPPQYGGSGKWLWEIYRRQSVGRYVMGVGNSQGAGSSDAEYPHSVERLDLTIPYRGLTSITSVRHYALKLRRVYKLCRRSQISQIHAARPLSEGLLARATKAITGIPYICYVHGEDINVATTSRELTVLTRNVLNSADGVIVNSTFTKGLLESDWSLPSDRIALMHPGVNTAYFKPAENPSRAPEEWRGKSVILTVGRLQERKGHDMVIQAISRLVSEFPELLYAIAGDGEDKPRLEKLAATLGVANHVSFLGPPDDGSLLRFYQHCDIFVLANRTIGKDVEGFGIVLLEAQSCGKPVIAGDSGGTVDTMLAGKTGTIVDCTSSEMLSQCLRRQLACPASGRRMGEMGRQHVMQNFDWEILAPQASAIFQRFQAPAAR